MKQCNVFMWSGFLGGGGYIFFWLDVDIYHDLVHGVETVFGLCKL